MAVGITTALQKRVGNFEALDNFEILTASVLEKLERTLRKGYSHFSDTEAPIIPKKIQQFFWPGSNVSKSKKDYDSGKRAYQL